MIIVHSFQKFYKTNNQPGYAATAGHRLKISQANKGKQPWNTGKNRSQEDIDKIRAAVNVHHERKLMANLQSIAMTKEEYTAIRKQIKLMRENVRRYRNSRTSKFRVATDFQRIHGDDQQPQQQQQPPAATKSSSSVAAPVKKEEVAEIKGTPPPTTTPTPTPKKKQEAHLEKKEAAASSIAVRTIKEKNDNITKEGETQNASSAVKPSRETKDDDSGDEIQKASNNKDNYFNKAEARQEEAGKTTEPTNIADEKKPENPPTQEDEEEESSASLSPPTPSPRIPRQVPERESDLYNINEVPEIYRRDFEWTPHPVFGQGDVPFQGTCPTGGPGGLICCRACTAMYCDYLTSTYNEIEDQKMTKAVADLETVTQYLEINQERLTASVRAAHRKPPPSELGKT